MEQEVVLSYLAGAMDADGCFSIKVSTYHMRKRLDAHNPVFSEILHLKQVTPQVPALLKETFGGHTRLCKGQTPNSKPLWSWSCTDAIAARAAKALLPFLHIKKRQAEIIIELRKSKRPVYRRVSYWFQIDEPNWQSTEMLTSDEVMRLLGYTSVRQVHQAYRNGTLLGLPGRANSGKPRFPKCLVKRLAAKNPKTRPNELIAWRTRLAGEIRELNKIGLHGTPVYYRTGPFTPK